MLSDDGVCCGQGVAVLLGAVLILVLSIGLAWVPLLGPMVAGAVGAYVCGTIKRALLSAVLPAILMGIFLWWRLGAQEHGLAGWFVAVSLFPLVLADEIGLWLGVVLGGVIAARRHQVRGARPA